MKKAVPIIAALLMLVSLPSRGQLPELERPEVLPASPEASKLAAYISYPVSLANGLVQTSIPFYEIVDGDIRIPITLSYHASGLKANMRSGHWLGDGWSLTTGPSLSRTINGVADEINYDASIALSDSPTYQQLEAISTQAVDAALDEFRYSLPGGGGRLYLRRGTDGAVTPVTIPRDNIAVTPPPGGSMREFRITDGKGVRYTFGGPERRYCDMALHNYGSSSMEVPTSWKIREIRSGTTGRRVTFDYSTNITEVFCCRYSDALVIVDQFSGQQTRTIPAVLSSKGAAVSDYYLYDDTDRRLEAVPRESLNLPSGYTFPASSRSDITQYNSYVRRIDFSGGHVLFNMSSDASEGLESVEVYDLSGNLVKRAVFSQTYTADTFSLRLDSVSIESTDASQTETYSFAYRGSSPPRDTRSIDRWGYNNGRPNATLVPTVTTAVTVNRYPDIGEVVTVTVPGGNREPDGEAMQSGVLTSVTYPTGGRTEFSYEAHRYADDDGTVRLAGGLRIRQIRDIGADGSVLYRNFSYSTDANGINGCGILNVIPASSSYPADSNEVYYRETACTEFAGGLQSVSATYKERVWTDNSMVGLVSDEGSSVSYPYVTETRSSDAAGTRTAGETHHSFDVATVRPLKRPGTSLVSDNRKEWMHGQKTAETAFAAEGAGDGTAASLREVRRQDWSYTTDLDYGTDSTSVRQRHVYRSGRVYGIAESSAPEQYRQILCQTTTLTQGRRLPDALTETDTESNGSMTTVTRYAYDAFGNMTSKTEDVGLPGHDRRVTSWSYPQDMDGGAYAAMASAGMTGIPVETRTYRNSAASGNLLTTLTTAFSENACASGTFFAPSSQTLTLGSGSGGSTVRFNAYDRRGNLLEFEDTDGRTTAFLWGYGGLYPVASITGAGWEAVKTRIDTSVLYGSDFSAIGEELASFRDSYAGTAGVHVTACLYAPLTGPSSMQDPSGRITEYAYDGLGRLSQVSLRNGGTLETAASYSYRYGAYAGANRIRSRVYLDPDGDTYTETNDYFDLLGRPVETVRTAASPDGKDIVFLTEYDAFGRPCNEYRPVPLTTSTGGYCDPETAKVAKPVYGWDPYAFSKTLYEASPLDRVTEEYGPGSTWHTRGKSVRTEPLVNETSGVLSCRGYAVASDTSLTAAGVLSPGTLAVVRTTGEDGDVTLTFTDRLGRTVLERRLNGSLTIDTYRVHDDLGLLRYVLTPEAAAAMSSTGVHGDSSSPLSTLAYIYKYDGRGRLASEKRPGTATVLYRYDRGAVPVYTQDGGMRARGEWRFSFRDAHGRDAVSGIWHPSYDPVSFETATVATYTGTQSPLGGYSLNVAVPQDARLLSVSYYDGYSFIGDLTPAETRGILSADSPDGYGAPDTGTGRAKGLLTGTAVYTVPDTEAGSAADSLTATVSAFYYDRRGRAVQSHHAEALGGSRHVHRSLTFTGREARTRETVFLPDGRADSLVTEVSYDSQERPVSETAALGGRVQSMTYSYDAVGRMTGRTRGAGSGRPELAETLSYNVRDQLTGLSSDVFGMTLRYHDPALGSTPRYNGAVSEWEWRRGDGTGADANAWSLTYDAAGRLTDAKRFSGGVSTDAYGERALSYDRNGNILSLTRYGADATSPAEVLAYSYNGNMLSAVANSGSSGGGGSFTHDTNGNLTHDGLSGIDIGYDALNMTRRIASGGTTLAEYVRLADGTKLCAVDGNGDGYQYRGSMIYSQTADQSGAVSLALDCAMTAGGRIVRVNGADSAGGTASFRVLHYLRDHLGSVRAIVDGDSGDVIEANDYYPFGKRIAIAADPEHDEGSPSAAVPTSASAGSATAQSVASSNRWLFSGKESQSFLSCELPFFRERMPFFVSMIALNI